MNSWIEAVLDGEDMRRRCEAHGRWMRESPAAVAFSEAWADRNLGALGKSDLANSNGRWTSSRSRT